ncbi:alpha/beta fold hydrolase [Acidisarcina polymorpha]
MTAHGTQWIGEDAEPRGNHQEVSPERQAPSAKPVVFVLPGLGGEEDPELEKFWAPSRDKLEILSLRYVDWTDLVRENCDFSSVVTHVKRQIENRLPAGPVRMAGYSIGGHLAYALAVSFQAEGRPVVCVVLLDSPAELSSLTPPFRKRMKARLDGLLAFNPRASLASLFAKVLIREQMHPLLRRFSHYRSKHLPFRFDTFLHRKITMQLIRRIFPAWWGSLTSQGIPLTMPTFLFRSGEHEPYEADDLGWQKYCPDLKVIPVPGTHRGMLDPSINGPLRAAFLQAMK